MTHHDDEPAEALARNVARIKTEGLDAATEAAISLLKDPKAPAQAKSATINAIYRAAGLFKRDEDDDAPDPHEMTAAELGREVRRLTGELKEAASKQGDVGGGAVFD